MIYVMNPREKVPAGAIPVDVTSRSKSPFSPFYCGTDQPLRAARMENAWQYSKVYAEHDNNGVPTQEWYKWHRWGLYKSWADRYPMGKGVLPVYSWYNDQAYGYVEARKVLYDPLYRNMIRFHSSSTDLHHLQNLCEQNDVALIDFDGYNDPDKTYEEIINDPTRKMGHAFVLREILRESILDKQEWMAMTDAERKAICKENDAAVKQMRREQRREKRRNG